MIPNSIPIDVKALEGNNREGLEMLLLMMNVTLVTRNTFILKKKAKIKRIVMYNIVLYYQVMKMNVVVDEVFHLFVLVL